MDHNAKHLLTRKVMLRSSDDEWSIIATTMDTQGSIFVYLINVHGHVVSSRLDEIIFCEVWDEEVCELVPRKKVKG